MPTVKISTRQWSVDEILQKLSSGQIVTSATRPIKWSQSKKSKFIESMLLDIPTFPLLLDHVTNDMLLLDGHERLDAVVTYLADYYKLIDLTALPELNGKNSHQIDAWRRRCIRMYAFMVYIVQPETDRALRKTILERLTGEPSTWLIL